MTLQPKKEEEEVDLHMDMHAAFIKEIKKLMEYIC